MNLIWMCSHLPRLYTHATLLQANAHDFVSHFPEGYETNCGEKGAQMSGGVLQGESTQGLGFSLVRLSVGGKKEAQMSGGELRWWKAFQGEGVRGLGVFVGTPISGADKAAQMSGGER